MIVLGMGKAHDRQSLEVYQSNARSASLRVYGEPYQAIRDAIEALAKHCRETAQAAPKPTAA